MFQLAVGGAVRFKWAMSQEPNRIDPRQEADWKSIEFRRPGWVSRDGSGDPRFAIAIGIFLLVALVYPWYSNWVDYYLATRVLERVTEQLSAESGKQSARLSAQLQQSRQSALASQARYAARSQSDRVAGVRVMGVSDGAGKPLVIVDLGQSNIYEGHAEICRQAAMWLHRDVSGLVLRIQRHRSARPALDGGELACR